MTGTMTTSTALPMTGTMTASIAPPMTGPTAGANTDTNTDTNTHTNTDTNTHTDTYRQTDTPTDTTATMTDCVKGSRARRNLQSNQEMRWRRTNASAGLASYSTPGRHFGGGNGARSSALTLAAGATTIAASYRAVPCPAPPLIGRLSEPVMRPAAKITPWLIVAGLLVCAFGTSGRGENKPAPPSRKIDFNRDIRPILAENCYTCHGPDSAKRISKLRLDIEEVVKSDLGGHYAIVPGDPNKSELIRRISSDDKARRMPPAWAGA